MNNIPEDREYTADHEWVRLNGETATIGLTPLALEGCPEVQGVKFSNQREIRKGELLATIHFIGATYEVMSPLSGTVTKQNTSSEIVRALVENPYEEGWLCEMAVEAGEELELLHEPSTYRELTESPVGDAI